MKIKKNNINNSYKSNVLTTEIVNEINTKIEIESNKDLIKNNQGINSRNKIIQK